MKKSLRLPRNLSYKPPVVDVISYRLQYRREMLIFILQINVSENYIYICRMLFVLYVAKQNAVHGKLQTFYCCVFHRSLVTLVA